MRLRLKELRNSKGWTIDQLADATKLSRGFISQLENGRRDPSAETLLTLSAALNVPVINLIEDEGLGSHLPALIQDLTKLPDESLSAVAQIVRSMLPKRP